MTKIDLLWHAQSNFNIGIHELDSDITEFGKHQSSNISGDYDLVICSNLKRTLSTLLHSKIKCNKLVISELCREIKGGSICDYLENEDMNQKETSNDI